MKSTNRLKGNAGEAAAVEYLKSLGWEVLERNWHFSKHAEIDIIAKDADTFVFVEVKTRSTTAYGHPFEAVNEAKLRKINDAALKYLNDVAAGSHKNFRIDLISVLGYNSYKIDHLRGVGF